MSNDAHLLVKPRLSQVVVRFLRLFAPLSLLLVGALVALLYQERRGARAVFETKERNQVELASEIVVAELQSVVSDLQILADSGTLHDYLRDGGDEQLAALAAEHELFSQRKQIYDQVRYLDERGLEVVRVNLRQGRAEIVPGDQLQSKADRYYFSEALRLDRGGVFVSPFDLNVENGQIERPAKPTIRFGAPVFDREGRKRGIVILNYLGDKLLDKLRQAARSAPGEVMLLNADGYWLQGPTPENDWAFMYPNRGDRSFAVRYPDIWLQAAREDRGQFSTGAGLFTFATVYPLATAQGLAQTAEGDAADPSSLAGPGYHWHIVSRVAPGVADSRPLWMMFGLPAGLLVVLAVGCWFVARSRAQHESAANALRENEERFRQLAENIDDVFWISTPGGERLIYVSPAYEPLFGRSCQSLYERPLDWLAAVVPEDRERVERELHDRAASDHYDVEYRIVRPDGSLRWIWDRGFPVRDASGQVYRVAGIKEDVTALKAAQARALQTERLAAIGEAMTGLAHESRNALQRSQAGLEMLARRLGDRADSLDLLAQVQQAQHHLHRLYEEVRNYAAPLRLHLQPLELGAVVDRAWEHLAAERQGRDARLVQSLGDARCVGDPVALEQVFRNVLENALQASPDPAEIEVTCEAGVPQSGAEWRVILEDSGPGLSPEQAAHIFEPFYTTKVRGTGLGMAICRRIVEEHGGSISVGQRNGRGARIIVTLPRSIA